MWVDVVHAREWKMIIDIISKSITPHINRGTPVKREYYTNAMICCIIPQDGCRYHHWRLELQYMNAMVKVYQSFSYSNPIWPSSPARFARAVGSCAPAAAPAPTRRELWPATVLARPRTRPGRSA